MLLALGAVDHGIVGAEHTAQVDERRAVADLGDTRGLAVAVLDRDHSDARVGTVVVVLRTGCDRETDRYENQRTQDETQVHRRLSCSHQGLQGPQETSGTCCLFSCGGFVHGHDATFLC